MAECRTYPLWYKLDGMISEYLDSVTLADLMQYPFQTSWGASTRLIGAIIMTHGDDDGLILPPAIAPVPVSYTHLDVYKRQARRWVGGRAAGPRPADGSGQNLGCRLHQHRQPALHH